jgi:hypothetical protein
VIQVRFHGGLGDRSGGTREARGVWFDYGPACSYERHMYFSFELARRLDEGPRLDDCGDPPDSGIDRDPEPGQ